MATRIQQRRGTAAEWLQEDPILESGEIGVAFNEDGTQTIKIGDGELPWSLLPEVVGQLGPTGPAGDVGARGPVGPKGDTGATGATGGNAFVLPTAPTGPSQGMLWFDTDDGRLYMYYTDANTSQWVQINVAPPTA